MSAALVRAGIDRRFRTSILQCVTEPLRQGLHTISPTDGRRVGRPLTSNVLLPAAQDPSPTHGSTALSAAYRINEKWSASSDERSNWSTFPWNDLYHRPSRSYKSTMDYGFAIGVIEIGEDPRSEFVLGHNANVAEHGSSHLGEEAFHQIEPRAMFRGKRWAALGLGGQPLLGFLGGVGRVVVEDHLMASVRWISGLKFLSRPTNSLERWRFQRISRAPADTIPCA